MQVKIAKRRSLDKLQNETKYKENVFNLMNSSTYI